MSKKNQKIRDKKRRMQNASVPVIEKRPEQKAPEKKPEVKKTVGKQTEEKTRKTAAIGCLYGMAGLFFMELVFKASTARGPWGMPVVYALCFSVLLAGLIHFLTGLIRNMKARHTVRMTCLVIATVWFIINYFIYRTFKVFYDVKTIFAGGGDAMTGFTDQIVKMVLSPSGLLHILLFALPPIFCSVLNRRYSLDERPEGGMKAVFCAMLASSLAFTCISIPSSSYKAAAAEEYSYQTAVQDFGLATGTILDVVHHAGGTENVSFEISTAEPQETAQPEETPQASAAPTPIVYGYNSLDIDFDALAETASGTTRQLDEYVASLTPSKKNEWTGRFAGKNLIFISAEAFSGDIIDPDLTPTLYRLATKGIQFTDYYQPASAGTTGGEYENVFGMLPMEGGSSFKMTADHNNSMTMGFQLDALGYNGWAFHPNDDTYYDRNITHNKLGYSNGFYGYGNGMENVITKQWPQSDLEMMQGTIDLYISHQPFNVYYMSVSGHNPYTWGNAMSKKHEAQVQDLPYNDEVKAYIAANLELEDALTYLIDRLEEAGIADDTVIVMGADHFPYGLSDENAQQEGSLDNLYGYHVTNYLERDHNRLILWCGELEKEAPVVIDTPTSSLDILPTLSNLFGVDFDSRLLPGRDVFSDKDPLVFNTGYDWKTDKGTWISSTGTFTPAEGVAFASDEAMNDYVKRIRSDVRNRISYCTGALDTDYLRHVFGAPHDPVTPVIETVIQPLPEETAGSEETAEPEETEEAPAAAEASEES